MSVPHLKLLSNDYKNYVFKGFSHLQEQQEFVDLTLAADGHIVKVHRNIIALASPYLKEMLKLTPSHNPVIFLNNVTHTQLCYLLEYIYQGEVSVPEDSMETFLQVAKALHIINVHEDDITKTTKDVNINQVQDKDNNLYEAPQSQPAEPIEYSHTHMIPAAEKSFAAHITINSDHNLEVQHIPENIPQNYPENTISTESVIDTGLMLPTNMPNIHIEMLTHDETDEMAVDLAENPTIDFNLTENTRMDCNLIENTSMDFNFTENTRINSNSAENPRIDSSSAENPRIDSDMAENPRSLNPASIDESNKNPVKSGLTEKISLDEEAAEALKLISQYSVSERGSLQIVASRYIYYCHHVSKRGHRWRCMDYRKLRCPAYIDSLDGVITARKGLHTHTFHDKKIHEKLKKNLIFNSVKQALQASQTPIANAQIPRQIDDIERGIEASVVPRI